MITELTSYQKNQLEVYKNKWLQIGLSTDRFTLEEATPIIEYLYVNILKKTPVPILIFDSPISAWIACLLVCGHELGYNEIWDEVDLQIGQKVRQKVGNKVREETEQKIALQIRQEIQKKPREIQKKPIDFIWPYLNGQLLAGYFGYYDYFNTVLNVPYPKHWEWFKSTAQLGYIYPLDTVCILSQKPTEIHFNRNNQLHADGKPAIKYANELDLWCLNGIAVSKEIAETPAEKLNPKLLLTEKNADVRREIARKIGSKRILEELKAKRIDTFKIGNNPNIKSDEYELLLLDIGDNRYRPYLRMWNISEQCYHYEGVHPSVKTAEEAFYKSRYPQLNNKDSLIIGIS